MTFKNFSSSCLSKTTEWIGYIWICHIFTFQKHQFVKTVAPEQLAFHLSVTHMKKFFASSASLVLRVAGGATACPRCPWAKAGFSIRLTFMFSDCERKLEHPRKNCSDKARTCKRHRKASFLLWGDTAHFCTTVRPNAVYAMLEIFLPHMYWPFTR